jgi:hypothetical protein
MIKRWIRIIRFVYQKTHHLYPLIFFVVFICSLVGCIHLFGKIKIEEHQDLKIISSDLYVPLRGISNVSYNSRNGDVQ